MGASIPADGGDGNGGPLTEMGQAALERALAEGSGRAALLLLDGAAADAGTLAEDVLRRADAAEALEGGRLAVFAPHLRDTGGAADLAARVLASLTGPSRGHAAIGIGLAPEDARDWAGLHDAAEAALARAEAYETGRFAFADADRDARYRIGPLLAGAIAEALAHGEYRLVYQPIARLADGAVAGAEALIRWRRPGGENWPPAVFIPEAERRGLMEPITGWTFRAACARLGDLPPGFKLGVNLSATMLGAGAGDLVEATLAATGAPAERLTVEITETAAFLDDGAAIDDVRRIADLGCGVAIDDFGAGNASLAYVVRLPATRIKLDASLSAHCLDDARARAAIAAAARLAADVGADVVAEGVRALEMAAALLELGVGLGQGRLFGPPADALLLDSAGADR